MHTLIILLGIMVLSATASGKEWSVEKVSKQTTVKRDEFKKRLIIRSPQVSCSDDVAGQANRYEFVAIKPDGGEIKFYLLFTSARTANWGWARWNKAIDEHGKEFEMNEESSNVSNISMAAETASGVLPREYLELHKKTGVNVKIYGARNAEKTILLLPNIIAGFLQRADSVK